MLVAVAAHPGLTVPVAVVIVLLLLWYWNRLGREDVPASRRVIRRCSLAFMFAVVPALFAALSLFEPRVHQQQWVIAWTVVAFLMLLIIATALIDAINNLNLHKQERREAITEAAAELIVAVRKARDGEAEQVSSDQVDSPTGETEEQDADS